MFVWLAVRFCFSWFISSDQCLLLFLPLRLKTTEFSGGIGKKVCKSWLISWSCALPFAGVGSSEIKPVWIFTCYPYIFLSTKTSFLKEVTLSFVLLVFLGFRYVFLWQLTFSAEHALHTFGNAHRHGASFRIWCLFEFVESHMFFLRFSWISSSRKEISIADINFSH